MVTLGTRAIHNIVETYGLAYDEVSRIIASLGVSQCLICDLMSSIGWSGIMMSTNKVHAWT